jgi:hypothetical protein
MAVESSTGSVTLTTRPLNGIEAAFAAGNCRFACALEFPAARPMAETKAIVSRVFQAGLPWGNANRVSDSGAALQGSAERADTISTDALFAWHTAPYRRRRNDTNGNGAAWIAEELGEVKRPAAGPLDVVAVPSGDILCDGLVINASHILLDGASMLFLVRRLADAFDHTGANKALTPVAPPKGDSVLASMSEATVPMNVATLAEGEPRFLPAFADPSVNPLTADEAFAPVDSGDASVAASDAYQPDVVARIDGKAWRGFRAAAAAGCEKVGLKAPSVTALHGVLVAAAVARNVLAHRHVPDRLPSSGDVPVSVSLLVNLRCFVSTDVIPEPQALANCFGTVTCGVLVPALVASGKADAHTVAEWCGVAAANLKTDYSERIARGEAHRQCHALARGDFAAGAPSATVELSSHGIYWDGDGPIPLFDVTVGQCFSGADSVSVAAWGSQATGAMGVAASVGVGKSRRMVHSVIRGIEGVIATAGGAVAAS